MDIQTGMSIESNGIGEERKKLPVRNISRIMKQKTHMIHITERKPSETKMREPKGWTRRAEHKWSNKHFESKFSTKSPRSDTRATMKQVNEKGIVCNSERLIFFSSSCPDYHWSIKPCSLIVIHTSKLGESKLNAYTTNLGRASLARPLTIPVPVSVIRPWEKGTWNKPIFRADKTKRKKKKFIGMINIIYRYIVHIMLTWCVPLLIWCSLTQLYDRVPIGMFFTRFPIGAQSICTLAIHYPHQKSKCSFVCRCVACATYTHITGVFVFHMIQSTDRVQNDDFGSRIIFCTFFFFHFHLLIL